MAEGFARQLAPQGLEVSSAGSVPTRLNPFAVRAMREVGIDISSQRSKSVDEIDLGAVSTVVTLCAEEVCPVFPGSAERLHWPFPDPAAVGGTQEEILAAFREVRDQIRDAVAGHLAAERG